jgi:hypothetical protein
MTKPISDEVLAILEGMKRVKPTEAAKRMAKARAETVRVLDRAKSYSPEFQDQSLIATYEKHLGHLDEAAAKLAAA